MNKLWTRIPGVGFIVGHFRLFMEYVLIGLVIACAAMAFALWNKTQELEKKNEWLLKRVVQNETINEQQEKTIAEMTTLRAKDAEVLARLIDQYNSLRGQDRRMRHRLADLEKKNERVQKYLDQPIPDELACMLNGTCRTQGDHPGSEGDASGGAVTALRAPGK